MKNAKETPFKAKPTKLGGHSKYDPFADMIHGIVHRSKEVKLAYLTDWYIGVAKKRGWDAVVKLMQQNPDTEAEIKMLIKKRLGK